MGIPLPALGLKPPDSPLEDAGKFLQLKSLLNQQALAPGQQQLQQEQLRGEQQRNQMQGLQLQDEQKLRTLSPNFVQRDANGNITGYDFNAFANAATASGVSQRTIQQIQMQRAEAIKNLAGADEATRNNELAKNKIAYETIEGVKSIADPQQRQQAYQQGLAQLHKMGDDISKLPPQAPDNDTLTNFETALGMHGQILADAKTAAETSEKLQQAATAKATQAHTEMETAQGGPPGTRELNDWLSKHPSKGPADYEEYMKKLVPQFNFNLQGGAAVNPNDPVTQALVKQVAYGKMKITDVLTARTPLPARKAFLGQVVAENPDFDSRSYDVEKGVMKDFTSGKSAQNLTAFNTAIEHSKQLQSAADALQNGDMPTLNKIGNTLGYQFGSDKTTNFNVIKNALSGEISKVFKGGQATDAEIKEVQGPFDAANSPAQLKGAINNAIKLMGSKRDALRQQYEAGKQGKPNFGESGNLSFKAPNGKTYNFKDQQSLDNFKKEAGIQ